ncbi:hypothetical protein J437_LFUL002406 [Ladona fulva]|uniref:B box-type domain-containing protein n=1 Tax=Ladona fulva TaxID=123851 RepID=A0A8K0K4G8_LADFU|nr:hypothetical protein J437_LFUL002406 [Ladona fulva]
MYRSLTVVKSSTPPTSPPLQRKYASFRSGGPSPFAAFPWRKRSSITVANEGVILLLRCPTCGTETEVPTPPGVRRGSCTPAIASSAVSAAVATLPLHVVLQHRMYLAALNRKAQPTPRPKCDLCTTDATSRCTDCVLTLCALCAETHRRQRSTATHSLVLLPLDHTVTSRVSRVSMCPMHPNNAQRLFCGPCGKLACRACPCATSSGNHRCEPVAHAARNWAAPAVRTALEKARPYAENACASVHGLRHIEQRVQMRTAQVEEEVDCFVDSWIRSLEEHRRVLHAEARRARDSKLEALRSRRMGLERRAESISVAVRFADELLTEATDAELLGLAGPLIRRLEWCRASAEAAGSGGGRGTSRSPFSASPGEQSSATSLQFLPAERAGSINGHEMYGVVTAQTVCPAKCRIFAEGLANCRQHRKTEVIVVTRDSEDQPIGHGGEQVVAELRYRDASHRVVLLQYMPGQSGLIQAFFIAAHFVPVMEIKKLHVHVEERCQEDTKDVVMVILDILVVGIGHAVGMC